MPAAGDRSRAAARDAARRVAEEKCRAILDETFRPEELALLFHLLRCAGWSTDRARTVLEQAGWWLS